VAVAIDAATDGGAFSSSSSRSFSHTVGVGSNTVLYAVMCFWNSGGTVTACTYGGTGLTLVRRSGLSSSQDRVEFWRLLNPTAGAATLAVTFSAAADGEVAAISFTGVDQTTPERTAGGDTSGSAVATASISATGAQTGDAILDGFAWDFSGTAATMVAHTGRTQRFMTAIGSSEGGAGSTLTSAPNPQTMDWNTSTARAWTLGYIVLAAAGAGGGYDPSAARIGDDFGIIDAGAMSPFIRMGAY
jgi:hypothetical protein